jgi:hypothetical protein
MQDIISDQLTVFQDISDVVIPLGIEDLFDERFFGL